MSGRVLLLLVSLLLADAAASAQAPARFAEQSLVVADGVVLAGELEHDALRETFPGRVLVVDLRTSEEGVAEERAALEPLGIGYRNLPVDGAVIEPATLGYLEGLLATRPDDETLILHCGSGNRAAMIWSALRIDAGEAPDDVLESVRALATKPPIVDAVRSYAGVR